MTRSLPLAPAAVIVAALFTTAGAAIAADRCAGNLDAAHIARCLTPSRSLTIGERPQPATANLAVQFDFGSAELTEDGTRTLEQLAEALRGDKLRDARFELAGHTDSVGGEEYNLALSQRRAEAARDFLQAHGIDPARLVSKGYGARQPYDTDHPDAPVNRRVQVTRLPP